MKRTVHNEWARYTATLSATNNRPTKHEVEIDGKMNKYAEGDLPSLSQMGIENLDRKLTRVCKYHTAPSTYKT